MSVPVDLDPQVSCALAPRLGGLAPQLCALAHGPARHPLGTMLIQSQAVDSLLVCFQCVCVCHPVHVGATLLILISIISSRLRLLTFFSRPPLFFTFRAHLLIHACADSHLRQSTCANPHLRRLLLRFPVSGYSLSIKKICTKKKTSSDHNHSFLHWSQFQLLHFFRTLKYTSIYSSCHKQCKTRCKAVQGPGVRMHAYQKLVKNRALSIDIKIKREAGSKQEAGKKDKQKSDKKWDRQESKTQTKSREQANEQTKRHSTRRQKANSQLINHSIIQTIRRTINWLFIPSYRQSEEQAII